MKILICNIPIRNETTTFPPVACTILCNTLINEGYSPVFYDIDYFRPDFEELSKYFAAEQYDLVGISAVVSTGYKYLKELAAVIRQSSPNTNIIVGGNLAVAYEIVLKKCNVDLCVIGEGEKVIINLVKHLEKYENISAKNKDIYNIKGIAVLEENGDVYFSGHEKQIFSDQIQQPDYEMIKISSNIDQYILDPLTRDDFAYDERTHEPHRKNMKMATISTSKGCVNSCTFCHRWIKKYRVIPVKNVISTIIELREKFNVGFFCITDECFGEDIEWLNSFIEMVKPLDILFQVGGARVSILKKDNTTIQRLKEVGLTAIYFGMESGSQKILNVMEKHATIEQNLYAARMCIDAGVYTTIQLVVGMPGENNETIDETIEFVCKATELSPFLPEISVTYLQALPGTPCYDYLKVQGLIGKSIEEEEEYLLSVSDINAAEFRQYFNVSEVSVEEAFLWRAKIIVEARINWLRKHGWKMTINPLKIMNNNNPKEWLLSKILPYKVISLLGERFWFLLLFMKRLQLNGAKVLLKNPNEDRSRFNVKGKSLRKIIRDFGVGYSK